MIRDFHGEGFDEVARPGGGECLDFQRHGVVVDGAGDFVGESVESLAGHHAHGDPAVSAPRRAPHPARRCGC